MTVLGGGIYLIIVQLKECIMAQNKFIARIECNSDVCKEFHSAFSYLLMLIHFHESPQITLKLDSILSQEPSLLSDIWDKYWYHRLWYQLEVAVRLYNHTEHLPTELVEKLATFEYNKQQFVDILEKHPEYWENRVEYGNSISHLCTFAKAITKNFDTLRELDLPAASLDAAHEYAIFKLSKEYPDYPQIVLNHAYSVSVSLSFNHPREYQEPINICLTKIPYLAKTHEIIPRLIPLLSEAANPMEIYSVQHNITEFMSGYKNYSPILNMFLEFFAVGSNVVCILRTDNCEVPLVFSDFQTVKDELPDIIPTLDLSPYDDIVSTYGGE